MNFDEVSQVISSRLLEVEIEQNTIDDIFTQNSKMYVGYDAEDEYDQMILHYKVAAIIELVISDKEYQENRTLSE